MTEGALRVCLDANVWVAFLLSQSMGRNDSVAARLVHFVTDVDHRGIQLLFGHELLDTLHRVLIRLGFTENVVRDFVSSLLQLAASGPDAEVPSLLVSGRDQIALHAREDAGVLASCIAARANLLVTDNLRDFQTRDAVRLDTRSVRTAGGDRRQLFLLCYKLRDGSDLVVMHPLDALSWLEAGERPTSGALRSVYGGSRPEGRG